MYLFVGKFFCVYVHTTSFTITAIRAASAIRQTYIKSLLRCDIAYFDEMSAGTVATEISTNADLIQNGLSEKLGVLFQGLAMLVSAYIVAFTRNWKLTLITATTMPAVILAVGITVMIVRMSRQICGVVSDLPKQRLCRSQITYQTNGSFLGCETRGQDSASLCQSWWPSRGGPQQYTDHHRVRGGGQNPETV